MVYKVDWNPQLDICDWSMYSKILKLVLPNVQCLSSDGIPSYRLVTAGNFNRLKGSVVKITLFCPDMRERY